ncbi:hypothetical protein FHG87_008547 [Trinorchestia longiramus]|nr:hypothetical protein FHG87_008547 [Trinorchestia longiramus]
MHPQCLMTKGRPFWGPSSPLGRSPIEVGKPTWVPAGFCPSTGPIWGLLPRCCFPLTDPYLLVSPALQFTPLEEKKDEGRVEEKKGREEKKKDVGREKEKKGKEENEKDKSREEEKEEKYKEEEEEEKGNEEEEKDKSKE